MFQHNVTIKYDFKEDPFINFEQLLRETKNMSNQFFISSFRKIILDIQELIMFNCLGSKWNKTSFMKDTSVLECPKCKQTELGFKRRGCRTRIIKSSFVKKFRYSLIQITCRKCNKTFSPFTKLFNIPKGQFTEEFRQKLISLATDLSYTKSSQEMRSILNHSGSSSSIHRWINNGKLPELKIATASKIKNAKVVLKDSTKVKAGNKEPNKNGLDINVSISLNDRYMKHKRPHNDKDIIAFNVGKTWEETMNYNNLNSSNFSPEILLTDGENTFDNLQENFMPDAKKIRCSWHAPRTLKWILKQQCSVEENKRKYFCNCFYKITKIRNYPQAQFEYDLLLSEIEQHTKAYSYLLNTKKGILNNIREQSKGKIILNSSPKTIHTSTSILERLMREINRRTDVGVRWTDRGCENLIKLSLIKKFQPIRWARIFKQKTHFKSVYKLQMSTF